MKFCLSLLALFACANASRYLTVVKAGLGRSGPLEKIADLSLEKPPTVCVEQFPKGISIQCSGTDVRGKVKFFVNGRRVKTERMEPYLIAGNLGLKDVFPWTGFRSIPALSDGTRRLRITCMHRRRRHVRSRFSADIIIAAPKCTMPVVDPVVVPVVEPAVEPVVEPVVDPIVDPVPQGGDADIGEMDEDDSAGDSDAGDVADIGDGTDTDMINDNLDGDGDLDYDFPLTDL